MSQGNAAQKQTVVDTAKLLQAMRSFAGRLSKVADPEISQIGYNFQQELRKVESKRD